MHKGQQTAQSSDNRSEIWLSLLLILLAATIFRVAEFDRNNVSGHAWWWVCAEITCVVTAFVWLSRVSRKFDGELVISPLLLVLAIGSLIWEWAGRQFWEQGRSFEIAVMFILKNTMLGLGAVAFIKRFRLLGLVCSLFLVLFSTALTRDSRVVGMIALYAFGGIGWLLTQQWSLLRYRLLSHAGQQQIPWRRVSLILLICGVPLVALGTSSEQIAQISRGWFPGSGGTSDYDPFARDGVGDGEMLVAGQENITSFAPIEDAPFITDEDPSLYDVFDDSYEEPVQTQQQDRAIALPPNTSRELESRLANSNQASREFSTLRKSETQGKSQVQDINTNALMFISGRVPLHLRMQTYDIFDGLIWYPEEMSPEDSGHPLSFKDVAGKPWLKLGRIAEGFFFEQKVEPHALKVATIDTNVIPSPVNLLGLHIDKANQPSMFRWYQDSILRMDRQRLPEAVTIRLSSGLVDCSSIDDNQFILGSGRFTHRALPLTLHMKQIEKLAKRWTAGCKPGWNEVELVVDRLRKNYQHDPSARPPEECVFPVGDFLLSSRRGEDYQFATAAAVLLRSLGYSTRLVSGFYASPDKYDSRTGLTPVHAEDVHFWVEVYLGGSVWQTVEATPGYEVLQPEPSLTAQMIASLIACGQWLIEHFLFVVVGSILVFWMIVYRREFIIHYHSLHDRLFPARNERDLVLQTARQLERNLIAAGSQRPPGVSPTVWIERQELQAPLAQEDWRSFSRLWTQTLFLPKNTTPPTTDEVNSLCWRIRKELSVSQMKRQMRGKVTSPDLRPRLLRNILQLKNYSRRSTRNLIETS